MSLLLTFVSGSLLDSKCDIIAHQTNCRTVTANGLAKSLFEKFPHANSYPSHAWFKGTPGRVELWGDGKKQRLVANLNGQDTPGPPCETETKEQREKWMGECLAELLHIMKAKSLKSVAFPEFMGCGMAKGSWKTYLKMLQVFASKAAKDGISVFIYSLTTTKKIKTQKE